MSLANIDLNNIDNEEYRKKIAQTLIEYEAMKNAERFNCLLLCCTGGAAEEKAEEYEIANANNILRSNRFVNTQTKPALDALRALSKPEEGNNNQSSTPANQVTYCQQFFVANRILKSRLSQMLLMDKILSEENQHDRTADEALRESETQAETADLQKRRSMETSQTNNTRYQDFLKVFYHASHPDLTESAVTEFINTHSTIQIYNAIENIAAPIYGNKIRKSQESHTVENNGGNIREQTIHAHENYITQELGESLQKKFIEFILKYHGINPTDDINQDIAALKNKLGKDNFQKRKIIADYLLEISTLTGDDENSKLDILYAKMNEMAQKLDDNKWFTNSLLAWNIRRFITKAKAQADPKIKLTRENEALEHKLRVTIAEDQADTRNTSECCQDLVALIGRCSPLLAEHLKNKNIATLAVAHDLFNRTRQVSSRSVATGLPREAVVAIKMLMKLVQTNIADGKHQEALEETIRAIFDILRLYSQTNDERRDKTFKTIVSQIRTKLQSHGTHTTLIDLTNSRQLKEIRKKVQNIAYQDQAVTNPTFCELELIAAYQQKIVKQIEIYITSSNSQYRMLTQRSNERRLEVIHSHLIAAANGSSTDAEPHEGSAATAAEEGLAATAAAASPRSTGNHTAQTAAAPTQGSRGSTHLSEAGMYRQPHADESPWDAAVTTATSTAVTTHPYPRKAQL